DCVVRGLRVMSDAEVAYPSFALPFVQSVELCVDVKEIMHLHQINRICSQFSERFLHLSDSCIFSLRPNLGSDEEFLPEAQFGTQVADHLFGVAVHRRRVNQFTSRRRERGEYLFKRLALSSTRSDIECLPCPQTNYRYCLTAGRDALSQDWPGGNCGKGSRAARI